MRFLLPAKGMELSCSPAPTSCHGCSKHSPRRRSSLPFTLNSLFFSLILPVTADFFFFASCHKPSIQLAGLSSFSFKLEPWDILCVMTLLLANRTGNEGLPKYNCLFLGLKTRLFKILHVSSCFVRFLGELAVSKGIIGLSDGWKKEKGKKKEQPFLLLSWKQVEKQL